MQIKRDGKGQPFIEWMQAPGGYKRAWIQRKTDPEKDWASTPEGRYLNVVRVERPGAGPAGNATDFPIFSSLPDEQILIAFVAATSAVTGCPLEIPQIVAKVDPLGEIPQADIVQLKVDPLG